MTIVSLLSSGDLTTGCQEYGIRTRVTTIWIFKGKIECLLYCSKMDRTKIWITDFYRDCKQEMDKIPIYNTRILRDIGRFQKKQLIRFRKTSMDWSIRFNHINLWVHFARWKWTKIRWDLRCSSNCHNCNCHTFRFHSELWLSLVWTLVAHQWRTGAMICSNMKEDSTHRRSENHQTLICSKKSASDQAIRSWNHFPFQCESKNSLVPGPQVRVLNIAIRIQLIIRITRSFRWINLTSEITS